MLSRILLNPTVPKNTNRIITRKYNSIINYINAHPVVTCTAYVSLCSITSNSSNAIFGYIIIPIVLIAIGVDDITPEHDIKFRCKRYAVLSVVISIYIVLRYYVLPMLFDKYI